jgi:hypothetical protein
MVLMGEGVVGDSVGDIGDGVASWEFESVTSATVFFARHS